MYEDLVLEELYDGQYDYINVKWRLYTMDLDREDRTQTQRRRRALELFAVLRWNQQVMDELKRAMRDDGNPLYMERLDTYPARLAKLREISDEIFTCWYNLDQAEYIHRYR